MADVSIGSVSLGMQLDKADLLSQMKDITQSAASVLQNGLSNALRMGKTDMSGVIGGIGEVKTEVKALATMIGAVIEKGMNTGAKDGVAAVTKAVSTVKMPTVKVTATKGDLTNQLDNMVALLDNTNAQIYTQQQLVDELKRRWAGMGNLGQKDSDAGLKMRKSLLVAEAALTSLEGKSDTMAMKTRAMDSAITAFGTEGKQAVQKVAAAATLADKKLDIVGNSGNTSGKKIASGMNSASKSVKSLSLSALSATGLEKRLSSIERNVEKTTRSVTALGRRFMVLFVGKIISAAFKDITASLTGASEKSDTLKNSLNALTTTGRTISNGVVTAIAPLINIVGPALGNVSEMIRVFSNRVAMFFAAVAGQDTVLQAKKSFAAYGTAASGAGDAAEKAQKQMAGFDNLNILPSATPASSGGSGSSGGTNAADFETVGTVGSDLATKVRAAIDTMLPQLTTFWDDVLVPLGTWTLTTGFPMLADGLAGVAKFFKENPELVDNLAVFLASLLPLSALGPEALAIGIALQVTYAAGEIIGTKLGDYLMKNRPGDLLTIMAIIKPTEDTTWYDGMVKAIGLLGVLIWANWTVMLGKVVQGFLNAISEGLAAYTGQDPAYYEVTFDDRAQKWLDNYNDTVEENKKKVEEAKLAQEQYNSRIEQANKVTQILSRSNNPLIQSIASLTGKTDKQKQSFNFLGNSATKSTNEIKTSVTSVLLPTMSSARTATETATSGINGAFGGMPSSIQAHLAALDATVKTGAQTANNSLTGKTAEGVNTALGSYSGMPSSVVAHMNALRDNVYVGSLAAKNALYDNTNSGANDSTSRLSHFSNDGTARLGTFAENVRSLMETVIRNMAKLPNTVSGARGFSGLTTGFLDQIHNLPMFANGAYVGANSPQLAIIGDNKTQGEIVTPENAMAAAVAKGIAAAGGGGSQTIHITVQSVLDGRVIAESTTKYQTKKSRQLNKPVLA